jgi:single-strand DNA-binding protein
MAYSINKVILVGNVGNEPEIKTFQNGNKVANLSIATSERWKDKETGEQKSLTEWHRVAIFNASLINLAEKYIKKGAKIYIEGQLQTRKWQDNSGVEKYSTEIVLQNYRGEVLLLDRQDSSETNTTFKPQNNSSNNSIENDKQKINVVEDLDDDIPF